MSKYNQIITLLNGTKAAINQFLTDPEDEHHRLKLVADLDRNMEYVSLLTNAVGVPKEISAKMKKATTIAGKEIKQAPSKNVELTPSQEKVSVIKQKVESAYPRFLKMESVHILNEFEDLVIRGIAKKAKMKVTKDDPEKIDLAFVEKIKEQIRVLDARDKENAQKKLKQQNAQNGKNVTDPVTDVLNNDTDDENSETDDEVIETGLEIKSNPANPNPPAQTEIDIKSNPNNSKDNKPK